MWPHLTLLVLFALTRLVARGVLGVRFFDHTLGYWQVLDPTLLETDLVRSCFFLHAQPPLYNLVLGMALKAAPATGDLLNLVFLGTSYLGIVGIYALLVELGTPRSAALAAAGLQTLSTTWLVYESWLFYTLPTAVLLTWACVFAGRACRGSRAAIPASAALVSAVAMLRSSYHLVWVVFALGLLLWVVRSRPHGIVEPLAAPRRQHWAWCWPSTRRTRSW